MKNSTPMDLIRNWYQSKCDGNWEHGYGVEIRTIDNPGWVIKLTGENSKQSITSEIERSDDDWIHIHSTDNAFTGHGGPTNFDELLVHAVSWLQR